MAWSKVGFRMATRSLYLSTFYFFGLSCFFLHSLLTFFISFTFYCNQKRRSAQNTHKYPSDLPGTPAHSLHVTNSLLHPWLATTQRLLCRTSTMHLHGQTSRTDTNPLHKSTSSLFISQKTLRQHKLPDFALI